MKMKMSKLFDYFKKKDVANETIPIDDKNEAEGYEYREPEFFNITLKDWKEGVEQSQAEDYPDRIALADVYKAMLTYDSQVIASVNQRKLLTVQGVINIFNEDGTINEDATNLFKTSNGSTKEWFRNFLNYSMDSIFYGYEVLAINLENGELKIRKIPERNVIPQEGKIMKDVRYGNIESNTFSYDEGKLDFVTCKISYTNDNRELGLLSACAPSFFSKCTSEWASHTRKYGQPLRVLKVDNPQNTNKLKAGHTALKNMMTGSFLSISKDDEFEYHGDNSKGSEMYRELNIECNNNISKIILGQTGTLDEKAYVGSAAVHESILGSIIKSDREFLESVVNSQLIPKLQLMGLLPNNVYFGIAQEQKQDTPEIITNIKTLSDIGYKVSRNYIEKTFDVELEKPENNIEE